MATRTVRLDSETEKALAEITHATGLPISQALKQGLQALRDRVRREAAAAPYDIYQQLDLGPGGHAIGPSTETGRHVRRAIARKLHR